MSSLLSFGLLIAVLRGLCRNEAREPHVGDCSIVNDELLTKRTWFRDTSDSSTPRLNHFFAVYHSLPHSLYGLYAQHTCTHSNLTSRFTTLYLYILHTSLFIADCRPRKWELLCSLLYTSILCSYAYELPFPPYAQDFFEFRIQKLQSRKAVERGI